jgi:hypothetical protein
MRWHILRTLLHKEVLRHRANRGGLALACLLVVASLLLTHFNRGDAGASSLNGGVARCLFDYWQDDPWVEHLRANVPAGWQRRVHFRPIASVAGEGQTIYYPPGTCAIQLRTNGRDGAERRYKVWLWHPGQDAAVLAPYEAWFWRESARYFQQRGSGTTAAEGAAVFVQESSSLAGGVDSRSAVTTALVLFALFFACVYLLPSLTCEERERGVLLAQALSPASAGEILTAKLLFYPVLGMGLAALLAGIANPLALARPFFWLALTAAALGSLGVGMTIACLARTQRTASMGALCYMLCVALLLFVCQQAHVLGVPYLALEYHGPRMLHAALTGTVVWYHWWHLAAAAVLAAGWLGLATVLFRRRGWQ